MRKYTADVVEMSALRECNNEGVNFLPGVVKKARQVQGMIGKNTIGITVEDDQGFELTPSEDLQDLVQEDQ